MVSTRPSESAVTISSGSQSARAHDRSTTGALDRHAAPSSSTIQSTATVSTRVLSGAPVPTLAAAARPANRSPSRYAQLASSATLQAPARDDASRQRNAVVGPSPADAAARPKMSRNDDGSEQRRSAAAVAPCRPACVWMSVRLLCTSCVSWLASGGGSSGGGAAAMATRISKHIVLGNREGAASRRLLQSLGVTHVSASKITVIACVLRV